MVIHIPCTCSIACCAKILTPKHPIASCRTCSGWRNLIRLIRLFRLFLVLNRLIRFRCPLYLVVFTAVIRGCLRIPHHTRGVADQQDSSGTTCNYLDGCATKTHGDRSQSSCTAHTIPNHLARSWRLETLFQGWACSLNVTSMRVSYVSRGMSVPSQLTAAFASWPTSGRTNSYFGTLQRSWKYRANLMTSVLGRLLTLRRRRRRRRGVLRRVKCPASCLPRRSRDCRGTSMPLFGVAQISFDRV